MRINFSIYGLYCNGGVRNILEIANELKRRGHTITIIHPGYNKDGKWFDIKADLIELSTFERFRHNIIRYLYSRHIFNSPIRVFFSEIEEVAKKIPDCDINIATNWASAFSVFHSRKGKMFHYLQHFDDLLIPSENFQKSLLHGSYYLPLIKIANSSWLKNNLKEKFNIDSVVINPAIDHNVWYPRNVNKDYSIKKVVCFGKDIEWKGFKDAINAIRIVFQKRNDVKWFVYGAREIGIIDPSVPYDFIKFPSDEELAKLYSLADVVFSPSWYESFPLPSIEAMACGTPVVTTRFGTEDYAFNEENSLVVPPREPEILANAILRILEDEYLSKKIRENAKDTARQFTWKNTVDKLEKLFE